jgi:hypothetical protein
MSAPARAAREAWLERMVPAVSSALRRSLCSGWLPTCSSAPCTRSAGWFPGTAAVTKMGRRLAGWALLAFAVFYLLTSPDGAAGFVTHAGHGLTSAAHSLASFLNNL